MYLDCGSTVITDTRKINKNNTGALFLALSGPNFNGNTFAQQALDKGCQHAIVDDETLEMHSGFILVDNVLDCLQELAKMHRQNFSGPVIGITGSNGKTTTKELIRACLEKQYSVLATQGNLNNHIGVPLTVLELRSHHDIAIIEMGTNHTGEIMELSKLANPNSALITSIGKAHLEGLGSLQGVATEKLSLFDYVRAKQGLLFANINSSYIQEYVQHDSDNVIVYDNSSSNGFEIELAEAFPKLIGQIKAGQVSYDIESSLFGHHNLLNIVAALTVGFHYGVPITMMRTAINELILKNNRTETIHVGNTKYYLDAYNANPSSMTEALKAFGNSSGNSKMIILGDMFELGKDEDLEHQKIVDLACEYEWEIIIVGSIFHKTNSSEKVKKFQTFKELNTWFVTHNLTKKEILIKGSRGMGLERLIAKYRMNN